jgi:hypothetical protein
MSRPITKSEFLRQAADLVREIMTWIGNCLGPLDPQLPMDKGAIRRFSDDIRYRLDRIERWEERD